MKLMWVCNMMPGAVQERVHGKAGSANWLDHALSDLRKEEHAIRVLCRGGGQAGVLDESCSFASFKDREPWRYLPQVEEFFLRELETWQPDVIHIWGTEYAHTLAMVNAAEKAGVLSRVVISIQGLCSVYAGHYAEGVPHAIQRRYTLRDLLRRDNIACQQRRFAQRGDLEVCALKKVSHIIGRTDWDKACTYALNPGATYHYCSETLREPFYEGAWDYEKCQKHRIFVSSCVYPVKGFHYMLEAMAQVVKHYPDTTLAVPGKSFLDLSPKARLRQDSYHKYLAHLVHRFGLQNRIEFLGKLSPEGMKEQYLLANVFCMPSTIENSPNSLGEAMVLGTPCISADVGGVTNMMTHGKEGYVYQSTAPYMLAHYILDVFGRGQEAATMGRAASAHAGKTHDPQQNLLDLLTIYHRIGK